MDAVKLAAFVSVVDVKWVSGLWIDGWMDGKDGLGRTKRRRD